MWARSSPWVGRGLVTHGWPPTKTSVTAWTVSGSYEDNVCRHNGVQVARQPCRSFYSSTHPSIIHPFSQPSFVNPFIYSLIHIYIYPPTSFFLSSFFPFPPLSIIYPSIHPPTHSSICSSLLSYIHSSTHLLIFLSIYPLVFPFMHLAFPCQALCQAPGNQNSKSTLVSTSVQCLLVYLPVLMDEPLWVRF